MFPCLKAFALGTRGTLSEQVELALLGQFRGLDVNILEVSAIVSDRGIGYGQSIFSSAKIEIGSWTLPFNLDADEESYQREIQRLPELAELSQQLSCTRVVTHLSPGSDDYPLQDNFEWHRKRLTEITEILNTHSCQLGVGFIGYRPARAGNTHEFIHSLEATVQLVESITTDNIGIMLDTYQWYACSGTLEEIAKLKPEQLIAVQICDVPESSTPEDLTETRQLPGTSGTIDAASILKTLEEIGYSGPVTPIVSRDQLRSRNKEILIRTTSEALQKVWPAEETEETEE